MAIEGSSSVVLGGLLDMTADLGNNGRSEGDVGNEVAVPMSGKHHIMDGRKHATYMMSTCNQSAPCSMVRAQSWPRLPKSAERIEGAMMVLGAMFAASDEKLLRNTRGRVRSK
jgi:hypothetical protein